MASLDRLGGCSKELLLCSSAVLRRWLERWVFCGDFGAVGCTFCALH
jgi:hypothetical protein